MLFQQNQKIVFIGDSITDCDCRGASAPYGNGYVSMVRNFLVAQYPERNLTIVNKGIGGNTVRDLDRRWEQDVIAQKPDWVSVCIGINDVWRLFEGNKSEAVPLDEYRATLHRLLQRTKDACGSRLILAEPYMIESNHNAPMRQMMQVYAGTMRNLATEFNAVSVDIQGAFDQALTHSSPSDWSTDHIHPNNPGHAIITLAFLRAFQFAL